MPVKGTAAGGQLNWGLESRPMDPNDVCGDLGEVWEEGGYTYFAVADGLGHGPGAREAADAALQSFHAAGAISPDGMMQRAHSEISRTRGCAALVGRFDASKSILECASVGNIYFKDLRGKSYVIPDAGILGHQVRRISHTAIPLNPGDSFAVCSDGVSTRMVLDQLHIKDPLETAVQLVRDYGYSHDDATSLILYFKEAAS